MDRADTLERISTRLDVAQVRKWLDHQDSFTSDWAITYLAESLFFERVILEGARGLSPGASILEIGGGLGFVSRSLASQGFNVTCFEPATRGFTKMTALSQLVDQAWLPRRVEVDWRSEPFAQNRVGETRFDFVFATNVLQHVPNPERLVYDAASSLSAQGSGRFICPNYSVPFDPHFNIPTFWSKRLAHRLFGRRIANYPLQESPQEFWDDLSFPRASQVRRALSELGVRAQLSRAASVAYSERLAEPHFLERKGPAFRILASRLRGPLNLALQRCPPSTLPIIDLRVNPPHG
jgi:2-polyprenyl-3-methyl-5-hydroxy-6-metoxy-1,4-benzoquinol methylase